MDQSCGYFGLIVVLGLVDLFKNSLVRSKKRNYIFVIFFVYFQYFQMFRQRQACYARVKTVSIIFSLF